MAVIAGIYGKTEPEYVGCVLSTYERNGLNDGQRHALQGVRPRRSVVDPSG